jgi:hypothetical protein
MFADASGRFDRSRVACAQATIKDDSLRLLDISLRLSLSDDHYSICCLQASIYPESVYFYDECISISDIRKTHESGSPAMDELPTDYTEHDLPLLVLSGLGHDGDSDVQNVSGTRVAIQSPECEGERAIHLRQQFVARDGRGSAWNANALPGPNGSLKYHLQPIGRVGLPS